MSVYYADTSVLLKRHIDELGDRWFRELVALPDMVIMTTELSIVEMYSAFNRLVREERITQILYQDLTTVLKRLFTSRYKTIKISTDIIGTACSVLERHPLRAYDSIHLASAIFANQELVSLGKPGLTFLTADHRLLVAAMAEGLPIFDPATAT